MNYKAGDRVKIKSLGWYNKNKDQEGNVSCGEQTFVDAMAKFCGKELTITHCLNGAYLMKEDAGGFLWTDKMIERYADIRKERDRCLTDFQYWFDNYCGLPDGYNVINATKIALEKKKKEYPKTYEECEKILGLEDSIIEGCLGYEYKLLNAFQKLLMCRDAYWKIAGEEMGLGKPWEPSENEDCFVISRSCGEVFLFESTGGSEPFEFPTKEMRDAFKKNFDPDLDFCKELL